MEVTSLLLRSLEDGLTVTLFVFVMMVLVDYLNVLTQGRLTRFMTRNRSYQYVIASLLAATPGCLGTFMDVTFYVHGLITFGAIAGSMIATCGDEAFVMLAMFPGKALLLFGILFVLGILSGWLMDKLVPILRLKPCETCTLSVVHEEECRCFDFIEVLHNLRSTSIVRWILVVLLGVSLYAFSVGLIGPESWGWQRGSFIVLLSLMLFITCTVPEHYLRYHILQHIIKRHIWRVFLWTIGALVVVNLGLEVFELESFIASHMGWVLVISAIVGVIPESGPHIIFVMMFAKGLIPFSVLVASSIVQDGHGMLPLLSYTPKDAIYIKLFNLIVGLAVGTVLYMVGM